MLHDLAVGFHVVQMAVMQVIDVAFVSDRSMTAVRVVLVIVMAVNVAGLGHDGDPFNEKT